VQLSRTTEGSGLRAVLLHGFTQTSQAWAPLRQALRRDLTTIAIDLPGHGATKGDVPNLWVTADAVAEIGGTATYVGYSMGGRIALHVALARPALVDQLVIVGAHPGIDRPAERFQRLVQDKAMAQRVLDIGVDAFIDEWLAQPMFSTLAPEARGESYRRSNTADGLAQSLRSNGTGSQDALWDRMRFCDVPTHVVVGEHDTKFVELGQRIFDTMPNATVHVVAGVGHSVPLEAPEALADLLCVLV